MTEPNEVTHHDAWWTIHGDDFFEAMVRCFNGEEPELVYIEYYANSDSIRYDKNGDEVL